MSCVCEGTTYRLDLADAKPEPTVFRRTQLRVPHSADEYVTSQV